MKFYRFNLNTDVEYEAVRSTVDATLGYSGSLTCISPYATAPVDQRGRVLLSLADNQPGYLSLVYQFGLLVTAKKAKELTQDEYDASFAPAATGSGGVSSWNDLTDKPTSFAPSLHASTHASGGSDAITIVAAQVSDFSSAVVAAAPPTTNASLLTSGTLADARLSGNVPLLVSGLIPSSYLPSYVDDVLEFANLAAFPTTGETGKIYVAKDTNLIYRWSGSVYIQVDPQPGTTDSLVEGTTNLYFTSSRALSAVTWTTLTGKPTFATVATSGSYTDLTNKPTIPSAYTLPVATAAVLGGVKQGSNVTIAADGTISVAAPVTSLAWSAITSTPTTLAGYGITNGVLTTDSRLSDARTPTAHAASHSSGGGNAVGRFRCHDHHSRNGDCPDERRPVR